MHAIAARTAIRPVLTKLHPNLVQTVEGRAKIERMVWDIMKSIDQEGLRLEARKRIDLLPGLQSNACATKQSPTERRRLEIRIRHSASGPGSRDRTAARARAMEKQSS